MNKESFRILKEINSLTNKISESEKIIAAELARIQKIETQRTHREEDLNQDEQALKEQKAQLQQIEDRIHHFSKLLETAKANTNNVFTAEEVASLEKQIDNAQSELDVYENKGLELIEITEEIESKVQDANTFLTGSLETILEIEAEINQENAEVYQGIKTNKERIKLLQEQLPPKVVVKLNELMDKGLKHGPLVEISPQNACLSCGYLIPLALITSVETNNKFHTCPGCGRILIPQSSKYM